MAISRYGVWGFGFPEISDRSKQPKMGSKRGQNGPIPDPYEPFGAHSRPLWKGYILYPIGTTPPEGCWTLCVMSVLLHQTPQMRPHPG